MSDMKQLDARQELLVITMEECGELIQACSKALRRGELFAYSDSETELKQEIADVQAMINLMVEWDVLSWTEIENGVERKRNKLKRWSKLIEDADPTLGEVFAEDIEDEVHAYSALHSLIQQPRARSDPRPAAQLMQIISLELRSPPA